jgi:hypothetical protein
MPALIDSLAPAHAARSDCKQWPKTVLAQQYFRHSSFRQQSLVRHVITLKPQLDLFLVSGTLQTSFPSGDSVVDFTISATAHYAKDDPKTYHNMAQA